MKGVGPWRHGRTVLTAERAAAFAAVLRRLPHGEQKALAARAGLHPVMLSRWRNEAERPTPGAATRLAHAMGLTLAELLDEEARD